jgi:tetratricopeptide (TPR) repeat protein
MQIGLAEAWCVRVRDFPDENQEKLNAKYNLANSFMSQGKYAAAEMMHRDVLEASSKLLGPEHPATLTTTNHLAYCLLGQQRYDEADEIQSALLDVWSRVFGHEHPNTLTTKTNIAASLYARRRYAEAELLQREMLEVQARVFGTDHRETLATTNNLASSLFSQRKYAEAEQLQRQVLAVSKRVFGPEHPKSLLAASNLAVSLSRQRKCAEAEVLLRELLAVQKRVLGAEHHATLETMSDLATCLSRQQQYIDESRPYMYMEAQGCDEVHESLGEEAGDDDLPALKKRKGRPGKQKAVALDSGAAGAVELPSVALSCPNSADDGMMATDAPREAPNPVKKPNKKAKTTGAEGGGATGVPLPPSAALGVPDVTAPMLPAPAQVPTSCTARSGK